MIRRLSLATQLGLLVAGTVLPMILFASAVVYLNYVRERDAAFDRVLGTVRSVSLVLNAEMQAITTGLEVLASSSSLDRGDLVAFRRSAQAFLGRFPEGASISLVGPDGAQLLNTNILPGAPLPHVNRPLPPEVFRTGRPVYSSLFVGSLTNNRLVVIAVPVSRDGSVIHELSFNPTLPFFQNIIERQRPDEDWTMSIFDGAGMNMARVPNPEQTVGQRASPTLYEHLFQQNEAKVETVSLEGVPLLTGFTRSPLAGWTVAAGIPIASLTGPLWHALAITGGVGAAMLAIGLAFALSMATRIARGEALQALLINELNHRVKNTLTTVQSLARQSFAEGPASNEARAKFDARLVALGQAHNVLSEEKWESADLRDVVTGAVAPFLPKNGDRLRMDGAPIRITPRCVLVLSMVLHELATNATKYGAWSSPAGTVAIAWVTNDGGDAETLRITWREMDGPPVRVPDRKGFGSRLIEEGLAGLGGSTSVRYLPDGLVCELEIPCD